MAQIIHPIHRAATDKLILIRMWTEHGDHWNDQRVCDPKLIEYCGEVAEAAKHSGRI